MIILKWCKVSTKTINDHIIPPSPIHVHAGVVDNSGLRFYYTFEEPENRAGIIFAGHEVVEFMIVPPQAPSYSIAGICSSTCTSAVSARL